MLVAIVTRPLASIHCARQYRSQWNPTLLRRSTDQLSVTSIAFDSLIASVAIATTNSQQTSKTPGPNLPE